MRPLGEAVPQRPWGSGTCCGCWGLVVPGGAEEPSPHELAPNGAIPHGHIPLSQPEPENDDLSELGLYVPQSPRDFQLKLILSSLGLSQGSENLLSEEPHLSFFPPSNLEISCSRHAASPKPLAGHSCLVCLPGMRLGMLRRPQSCCSFRASTEQLFSVPK